MDITIGGYVVKMDRILIEHGGVVYAVDNWKYSPYLNAMVNSTNSDHRIDNDFGIIYNTSSLLDIADVTIINYYIGYLGGGALPRDITRDGLLAFIALSHYMGHDFSDIELLLGTIDEKKKMYCNRVIDERIVGNMGTVVNKTNISVTVQDEFIMTKIKNYVYRRDDGTIIGSYRDNPPTGLHYQSGIMLGETNVVDIGGKFSVKINRTIDVTEKNGVLVNDKEYYRIVDGKLICITYHVDSMRPIQVLSYSMDGDDLVVIGEDTEPMNLIHLYGNIYVNDDVLYKIYYSDNYRIVVAYCSEISVDIDKYKKYVYDYCHTYLYDLWIRDNMRPLGLDADPLYGCVKIANRPDNAAITSIKKLFNGIDFIIAGGYALNSFNNNMSYSDIDLFFCGDNCDKVMDMLRKKKLNYTISGNSITIHKEDNKHPLQIILRRYSSPTEVIHGFDVDCSSIMIYGGGLYCTHRCNLALINNWTMFNTKRMSETYIKRLHKYSRRGFNVLFPDVRLVRSHMNRYLPLFSNTISDKTLDDNIEYMSEMYKKILSKKNVWKQRFMDMGIEPSMSNMMKVAAIIGGWMFRIPKVNSPGLVIGLLPKIQLANLNNNYIPDYAFSYDKDKKRAKPHTLNDVVWKEQDPTTQVTSTFNPLEYANFRAFLASDNYADVIKIK